MRMTFLGVALTLFVVTSVAAQSLNWQEYKNSAGNFSILMPAVPVDTKSGEDIDSHTILAFVGKVGYTVAYSKFSEDQVVNEAIYKEYAEGTIKASKCTVVNEAPASPAIAGLIGRHYRLECAAGSQKVNHVGNLYVGKHYTYLVVAIFLADPVDPPNVKKFVDSFALIDPAK
jgi:hypothetical protein